MSDPSSPSSNAGQDPTPQVGALLRAAVAFLVVGALLWVSRDVLSPPIVFGLALVALHPYRDHVGHIALLTALGVVTLLWLIATSGGLLAPFVVAMGLAYILDPVVDALQERGLGRAPAILLLAIPVVAVVVVGLIFGIPAIGRQAGDLIDNLPTLVDRLVNIAESLQSELAALPWFGDYVVDRLSEIDGESLAAMLEARQAELAQRSWQAVLGVGQGIGAALTFLGYAVLTPVLTFYLLRDWDGIMSKVEGLIPRDRHEAVVEFTSEYDHLLGRYLRGQVLVALIVGTLFAVGFTLAGIPYAILLGAFAAVVGVVPYLGPILTLIPALLVALISGPIVASLLKVGIVFAVVQTLDGNVISPKIVGESVGLHPVWIVLALTAGGYYLGFVGLLLGVPFAVGIKLLVIRLVERYRASRVYQASSG